MTGKTLLDLAGELVKAYSSPREQQLANRKLLGCENEHGQIRMFHYCGSEGVPWARKDVYQCQQCQFIVKIKRQDVARVRT